MCCVNHLFPFWDKPVPLAKLLRPVHPAIQEMLPLENGQFVACEWICQHNYLKEIISRNRNRTRGAIFTSADAAVMFLDRFGRRQIILSEWKYTESYYPIWLKTAKSGTDRRKIYEQLYQVDDCPLSKELIPDFSSLFYEPYYKLMRQQFWHTRWKKHTNWGQNGSIYYTYHPHTT